MILVAGHYCHETVIGNGATHGAARGIGAGSIGVPRLAPDLAREALEAL